MPFKSLSRHLLSAAAQTQMCSAHGLTYLGVSTGEEQEAFLGPQSSNPSPAVGASAGAARVWATHLFLNMERCGKVMGAPNGDGPKDSVC